MMSGGELMAVQAIAGIGSKLMGGGGGGATPAAAPPTPFDGIVTGQPGAGAPPAPPPPMPERKSLFSGAALTPDKAPMPMPTRNPLFSGGVGAPAPVGVAMPTKNPLFHDQAGGAAEAARGGMLSHMDVAGELADPKLPPYSEHGKTKTPPKFDNNDLARSQGFEVETIYGQALNGDTTGAPFGNMTEVEKTRGPGAPAAAVKTPPQAGLFPPAEASEEAPIQSSTPLAAPKLDEPAFDTGAPAAPKAKGGGLFGVTIPEITEVNRKLGKTSTNPLFQVGMGLLSSGYDGSNPFTQMNAGMGRIPGLEIAGNQEGRAQSKADQEAAEMAEMREIMALLAGTKTASGEEDEDARGGRVAKQAAKVVR